MNVHTEIEIDDVSERTASDAVDASGGPKAGDARLVGEVAATASEEGASSGGPGNAAVNQEGGQPGPAEETALEKGRKCGAPDEGPYPHGDDSETRTEHRGNDDHVWKPEIAPDGCWIPFSYALIRRCRDQERRSEMRIPLARAKDVLWI